MTHFFLTSMAILGFQGAAPFGFIKPLTLTVSVLALYLAVVEVLPHLSRRLWQRTTSRDLAPIGYYLLDTTSALAFVLIVSQWFSISWLPSTWPPLTWAPLTWAPLTWPPMSWSSEVLIQAPWRLLLGLGLLTMAVIAIVWINESLIEPMLQGKLVKSYRQYQQMLEVLFSHYPSFPLKILLIAPVVEEVMVRGILQGVVLFPSNGIAALLAAALVFSIIHLNPYQVAASMMPSLLLGILYYFSQALILCIAVHFALNLYSLYQLKSGSRRRIGKLTSNFSGTYFGANSGTNSGTNSNRISSHE